MVDFIFFAMAYVDSEAAVDAEFFALGAMGTWNVVPMAPLRSRRSGRGDAGAADLSRAAREGRGLTDEARGRHRDDHTPRRGAPTDTQKSRRWIMIDCPWLFRVLIRLTVFS